MSLWISFHIELPPVGKRVLFKTKTETPRVGAREICIDHEGNPTGWIMRDVWSLTAIKSPDYWVNIPI